MRRSKKMENKNIKLDILDLKYDIENLQEKIGELRGEKHAAEINRCTMTLLKLLNEDNRITPKVDETLKKINDTKAIIAHKEEEMKKYNNLAYGLECDIDRLENEIDDYYKAIEVLES